MYLGHDMAEPAVLVFRHRVPPPPPGRDFYPMHAQDRALLSMAAFDEEPAP